MKKLPAKTRWVVMPLLLTMLMTAVVSLIATIRAAGLHGIFHLWLGSWLFSWLIAFPTILIILPLLNKFLRLIIAEEESDPVK